MTLIDDMVGTEFPLGDQGRLSGLLLGLREGSFVQREQRVHVAPLHCVPDEPHQIWNKHLY